MASRSAVNTGNTVAIMLLELKRHFNTCDTCVSAVKARDNDLLCKWATVRILDIARKWDSNIALRLKARRSGGDFVYRCPDLNKHGPAYSMTAEPLMVTGVQDALL